MERCIEYGSKSVGRRSGLAYIELRASSAESRNNAWTAFVRRTKRRIARILVAEKDKAAKSMPAFSGAVGITVSTFTVLSLIAGQSRGFVFAVGGEAILAAAAGVGVYLLLKKLCGN